MTTVDLKQFISHFQKLYPNQNPSYIPSEDPEIPVDNIFVFKETTPQNIKFYHYISNGLAPYGFELSMRVGAPNDSSIPLWPSTVLLRLAYYVAKTGNILEHGHNMSWHGSIAGKDSSDSKLRNLLFSIDPKIEDFMNGPRRFFVNIFNFNY